MAEEPEDFLTGYRRGHLFGYFESESNAEDVTEEEFNQLSDEEKHLVALRWELESYVPCALCRRLPTRVEDADGVPDYHDACIASLPGVQHACCGHGRKDAYLSFVENGNGACLSLYGNAAIAAMEMLGGSPPNVPQDRQIPIRWR